MPRRSVVAATLALVACGGGQPSGDVERTQTATPGLSELTSPAIPTGGLSSSASPIVEKAVVLLKVTDGPNPRPVDVTYTSETGDAETVTGVSPGTWSKGGFWPVGASISLSATTDDLGNGGFSCEIMANGTRYIGAAEPRLVGNDIAGWHCTTGPVVVQSVL